MNKELIQNLISQVETQGKESDKLIEDLINSNQSVIQLDNTVKKIQTKLLEFDGDLPIDELIGYISELCPIVYFVLANLEKLGSRADIIEQMKIDKYNKAIMSSPGTATDKKAMAESSINEEALVSSIYSRAYKAVKTRTDTAQTTIDALKKALSAKMSEMQVMRSQNNVMSS